MNTVGLGLLRCGRCGGPEQPVIENERTSSVKKNRRVLKAHSRSGNDRPGDRRREKQKDNRREFALQVSAISLRCVDGPSAATRNRFFKRTRDIDKSQYHSGVSRAFKLGVCGGPATVRRRGSTASAPLPFFPRSRNDQSSSRDRNNIIFAVDLNTLKPLTVRPVLEIVYMSSAAHDVLLR